MTTYSGLVMLRVQLFTWIYAICGAAMGQVQCLCNAMLQRWALASFQVFWLHAVDDAVLVLREHVSHKVVSLILDAKCR